MGGVFRDYVLFASLFIGTLHAEGKLDDHGKTLSISLLFVSFFIRRFFIKKPPHVDVRRLSHELFTSSRRGIFDAYLIRINDTPMTGARVKDQ